MRSGRFSFGSMAVAAVAALSVLCAPAEARPKRQTITSSPKYAAIVVDAGTGKVLHAENADAQRFPASLTKMMTLYLTFEALERGKIKKSTPVVFSAQAAAQQPTKIGVKAGGSITVEQAILSLVTRSANDSSVALAELIGGSEQRFALMMTQKARALGMRNTVFRNPNGLPNPAQFTTARDMATLGIALREHYPQYYGYFSVRSFQFGRQRIGNHNRLLGRIPGVDGIKTGYTNASGFNLVSSVNDGNRRIVAVVMGGPSASVRDARMAQLIDASLSKAKPGRGALVARTAPVQIEADQPVAVAVASVASISASNVPTPERNPRRQGVAVDEAAADLGSDPVVTASMTPSPAPPRKQAAAAPKLALVAEAPDTAAEMKIEEIDRSDAGTIGRAGQWVVQVGSSPKHGDATAALAKAKTQVALLSKAEPYTTTFKKNGETYYRARFGGFASQAQAAKACAAAKQAKVACYATLQD